MGSIIANRSRIKDDEIAELFRAQRTVDPTWAKENGIIEDIRDFHIEGKNVSQSQGAGIMPPCGLRSWERRLVVEEPNPCRQGALYVAVSSVGPLQRVMRSLWSCSLILAMVVTGREPGSLWDDRKLRHLPDHPAHILHCPGLHFDQRSCLKCQHRHEGVEGNLP